MHTITKQLLVCITLLACAFPVSAQEVQSMEGMMMSDVSVDLSSVKLCDSRNPSSWRDAQTVEGVTIEEDPSCDPDMPNLIAAVTKGTNNVSTQTLNATGLAPDTVEKGEDLDGDGDPDVITIRLEIWGINEGINPLVNYEIAPGITPPFWVFAPKSTGMVTEGMSGAYLVRMPSPTIRVEQGDQVKLVVSNTHYLPHTVHLHGVDHPFVDENGEGNDGVPQTSEKPIMPGESRMYDINPRTPGTMAYHCHVQPDVHVLMGLNGMFVIEENKPNNWVQTFNIGDGKVRHRSVASQEEFDGEFDLHYQDIDKELSEALQQSDDPAVIAKYTNQVYDITERTADYFILNGKSFPYTLRESQIIVDPDSQYRLRVFNIGAESNSLHTHGHKVLVKSLDGIDLPEGAQYYRDVVDISAAQRADLVLDTTDDGLNSYGEGIWMFHDHHEAHITTDGIVPGGGLSFITYRSYLGEDGFPKLQGVDIRPTFTPEFYQKVVPIWGTYDLSDMFEMVIPNTVINNPNRVLGALLILIVSLVAGYLLARTSVPKKAKKETKKNKKTQNEGFAVMAPLICISFVALIGVCLLGIVTFAHAQSHAGMEGMEGIHIMSDGSVMLGTGETLTDATVTIDSTILLSDGAIVAPVMDMRSEETKTAYEATLDRKDTTTISADTTMDAMESGVTHTGTSNANMEGIEGIHIMPNGGVMLGNGVLLTDITITPNGMIELGSGEEVEPILDMRAGNGMRRSSNAVVVNENFDNLPLGCSEIAGEMSISVRAGVEFAHDHPGTMFTYDNQSFEDVPPCTLLHVTFENMDDVRHQFMVHDLPPETYPMGMFNIEINGKGKEMGTFITPPDNVTLMVHCGVPEHEAKGMIAQIKVGGGDGDLSQVEAMREKLQNIKDGWGIYLYIYLGALGVLLGFGLFYLIRLFKTRHI